jgi:DNA-binding HxlR family transcriptional regulator
MSAEPKRHQRRGYGQYCAVATALDLIGERWTLLIARDLLIGPKRYTDLREGLPGIATDLLTARLRTLEAAGLVRRRTLPKPAPATVYELTERGQALGPVVASLAQLGFSLLPEPSDDARVPSDALVLSLNASFRAENARGVEASFQLEIGADEFVVGVRGADVDTVRGTAADPNLAVRTDELTLIRLLRRELDPDQALASGAVTLRGPRAGFDQFLELFAWDPAVAQAHAPAEAKVS